MTVQPSLMQPPSHSAGGTSLETQLAAYRSSVTTLILGSIPDREPKKHLYSIVEKLLANVGKGIRPALCLATCRAFGGDEARALPSAGAIELLHNAFLVHDDIEDESDYRRGLPTLHRQYGVPVAINVGDAMNAMSVRLLRQNLTSLGPELSLRVFEEFDHMSIETIEGQAMELGWIRDNDCTTTEDDYLLMVLKKTGWYSFIQPMRIGALIAGRDPGELDAFNRFGYFMGAAFQIQDDVLNLSGNQQAYGKEIGGDLLEGKRTLILTHLFANSEAHEQQRLKAFFGKPRAQRLPRELVWLQALVQSRGSIEYARQAARQFADGARSEFESAFAGAAPGPARDFVSALLQYLVSRDR